MNGQINFDYTSGESEFKFYFNGEQSYDFKEKEIIIDPSILHFLLKNEVQENDFIFYIPDNLNRLIKRAREGSEERAFLLGFLNYWSNSMGRNYKENDFSWDLFFSNISKMEIREITSEMISDENEFTEFYFEAFQNHPFYMSFSPLVNVLADTLSKMLLYSKRSGKKILSKTRALMRIIREKIAVLELPEKFDTLVQSKQNIAGKIFSFPGGKGVKTFVGIGISIAGFSNPYFAAGGILFACFDPK